MQATPWKNNNRRDHLSQTVVTNLPSGRTYMGYRKKTAAIKVAISKGAFKDGA